MHLIKGLIMLILLSIIIIAMLHLTGGKDCISLSMILDDAETQIFAPLTEQD